MLRRQAQQQVTESFPNLEPSGRNGNAARKGHTRNAQQEHYERMLNTPETVPGNPLRLTERGREQVSCDDVLSFKYIA